MSKTWKTAEHRVGVWLGAKGLKCSGRAPLSGSNSGTTRSDTPHPTVFCEVKRAKKYLSVVRLWKSKYETFKKLKPVSRPPVVVWLPTVNNGKIVSKRSNICCFHNNDIDKIISWVDGNYDASEHEWEGNYPAAVTLYEETISVWKTSPLDRDKEVAHCAILSHGDIGFWMVINKDHIKRWYELVIEARINREKLIQEDIEHGLRMREKQEQEQGQKSSGGCD